jgi:23S rRNA (cytidine1920-2'-O)/16S rRNA (cytidine1409-2'-O)-methyltransferase
LSPNSESNDGRQSGRKGRLDKILVERGFFSSRSRAAAAVLVGQVRVSGQVETKAGCQVDVDADIEVEAGESHVSRGGLKLDRAFTAFPFDVSGKTALDAGASTGGFTESLLRNGAARVIAVDVGYGQLDWKLRQDDRVEVLERTNVRYLKPDQLSCVPEVATLDLSFISLKKVLPAVIKCLRHGYELVVLVKPQFEAGRDKVGKGGVVRDMGVHQQVLSDVWDFALESGCAVRGLTDSGVPGPSGNIEYLMYMVDGTTGAAAGESLDKEEAVSQAVAAAEKSRGNHQAG